MAFSLLKSLLRHSLRSNDKPTAHGKAASVAFIPPVPALHRLAPHETVESDQASMRLRVGVPARQLAQTLPVYLVPPAYCDSDPTLAGLGGVRGVIVGKQPVSFYTGRASEAERLLGWIERQASQLPIVVDFSDDLAAAARMYAAPQLAEAQRRLLAACRATVPCAALEERLRPEARHELHVIEDPYESGSVQPPRCAPGTTLKLAWFGVFGPPLRPFLQAQLASLARRLDRPVELTFVTQAAMADLVGSMAETLRTIEPRFVVRHVPWSTTVTARALADCDLVLLPQDAESEWGLVKSHNRLVETIRAGRLAIASPIPSYIELAPYAWVGDDFVAGIAWALDHPDHAIARIAAGQQYVEQRFSPQVVAAKWRRVLDGGA